MGSGSPYLSVSGIGDRLTGSPRRCVAALIAASSLQPPGLSSCVDRGGSSSSSSRATAAAAEGREYL